MHAWLVRLTQPEDSILWTWVAIALLHAAMGVIIGLGPGIRARRAGAPDSGSDPP